jgi:hypothetical protein
MRENRLSGSEGGATGEYPVVPTPIGPREPASDGRRIDLAGFAVLSALATLPMPSADSIAI